MEFNVNRMQLLSGVKSRDDVMNESQKTLNEASTYDVLAEEKIRRIIREEIQAYLHERKAASMNHGFASGRLGTSMGFAGPGFNQHSPSSNRAVSRGPGRSFGFGGPGFM